MHDQQYTEQDIAAKALLLLEEQLQQSTGRGDSFAHEALAKAELELIKENEDNWRDLDIIQKALEDSRRKGSTPAALIDRLMQAARHYHAEVERLTEANIKRAVQDERQLRTQASAKV